jgi:hypothetical protein
MQNGTIESIQGKGFENIGNPPSDLDKDSVVILL